MSKIYQTLVSFIITKAGSDSAMSDTGKLHMHLHSPSV